MKTSYSLTTEKTTLDSYWSREDGRLSVADGLFFLTLLAGGILRLTELAHIPLSPREAESALYVWSWGQAIDQLGVAHSPAYASLTAFLSQVLGSGDGVMRLIPAMAGLGLITLPWLLRPQIGTVGALVSSWLLAISPLATITSRTADGQALALLAVMGILVMGQRYQESGEQRWLFGLMAALALGLTSSPLFWSGLVTLLIAWGIARWLDTAVSPLPRPDRHTLTQAAVFGLLIFILLGTQFLLRLPQLAATVALPGQWLGQFNGQGGDLATLLNPFLTLVRYEMILLPLGVTAVFWSLWQSHSQANLSLYWIAALFVLLVLQRQQVENAVWLILPGYILVGTFANAVLSRRGDWLTWLFAGLLTLVGMLIFVNVARFNRVIAYEPQNLANIWLSFMAFAFTAVTIYFFWAWDGRATVQGLVLATLALFTFYHWGTGWWLSHEAANDHRERWVHGATTDNDLRSLVDTMRDISNQVSGSPIGLDVISSVDSPALRWYLRDWPNLQLGNSLPPGVQSSLILTSEQSDTPFGSDYLGTDFDLLRSGVLPETLSSGTPIISTLRWWLFQESTAVVTQERVILWVRADLPGQPKP